MKDHILVLYRFCNSLYYRDYKNKKIEWFIKKVIVKLFYYYYGSILAILYGAYIPYSVKIGRNVKFNHSFFGIYISQNAIIGNNCVLLQYTTIGSNQPKSNDAPIIGNNVFIGSNCCIVGKTVIGDRCTVGAGTTIANAHIKADSIVVGQKYRILSS